MPDLQRFLDAQAPVYPTVLAELRAGRKRSHWMWYIFPQLAGLGTSPTARFYALADRAEAEAYLAHPVLGARLRCSTALVNAVAGRSINTILGSPDDLKFRSCVTLFAAASGEPCFQAALDTYYNGEPDPRTVALLAGQGSRTQT